MSSYPERLRLFPGERVVAAVERAGGDMTDVLIFTDQGRIFCLGGSTAAGIARVTELNIAYTEKAAASC